MYKVPMESEIIWALTLGYLSRLDDRDQWKDLQWELGAEGKLIPLLTTPEGVYDKALPTSTEIAEVRKIMHEQNQSWRRDRSVKRQKADSRQGRDKSVSWKDSSHEGWRASETQAEGEKSASTWQANKTGGTMTSGWKPWHKPPREMDDPWAQANNRSSSKGSGKGKSSPSKGWRDHSKGSSGRSDSHQQWTSSGSAIDPSWSHWQGTTKGNQKGRGSWGKGGGKSW